MIGCMNDCNHCVNTSRLPSVPLACPICPERLCMQAVECGIKWSRCDCRKLKSWFDKNRRLIWALRWHLGCSPEFVQYFLLKLLFSNFGSLLKMNGPDGRSYYLPLTGGCDRRQRNIFDPWGNLRDPLRPSNVISVLNAMRDYMLQRTIQIADNEIAERGLLKILGPDDPLVQLVHRLNADVEVPLDLEALLGILLSLDAEELVETLPRPQKFSAIEDINNLYLRVAMPPTMRQCCDLAGNTDSVSRITERYDGPRFSNTSELLKFRELLEQFRSKRPPPKLKNKKRLSTPPPFIWHSFYPSIFRDVDEIEISGKRRLKLRKIDVKEQKETNKYLGYGYVAQKDLGEFLGKSGTKTIL